MFQFLALFFTTSLYFSSSICFSNTITDLRIRGLPQLLKLEKVTVGPYDHFQSTSSDSNHLIYFTQKVNLSPRILSLDLKSGQAHEFLEISSDSEQAQQSPDGKKIAYIYYKNHSRGELCTRDIESKISFCLPNQKNEVFSPFWINEDKIGYITKEQDSKISNIHVYTLSKKLDHLLLKGTYLYAQASSDGKYLILLESAGSLKLIDLETSTPQTIDMDLPGFSAFPRFSQIQKSNKLNFLYFTQYMNDTNKDKILDAKDNGVIFRISLSELFKLKTHFPEQITSSESNCNYAHPTAMELFLTCAIDGSLNIYKLPLTGAVPTDWNLKNLENAHETARSYEERLLLLNHLKFRFNSLSDSEYYQRSLMNTIFAQHLQSSEYYFNKLDSDQFDLLPLFFKIQEIISEKETALLNDLDVTELKNIQKEILSKKDHPLDRQLLSSLINSYTSTNLKNMKSVNLLLNQWNLHSHPLQAHWLFMILNRTLSQFQSSDLSLQYQNLLNSKFIDDETCIYYSIQFLKTPFYKSALNITNPLVNTMIQSQKLVDKIIYEKDPVLKNKYFLELDRIMNESKLNYPLVKGIFSITALESIKKDDFKTLELISGNWLRYQQKTNTEFAFARDIVSFALLNRGYSMVGQKK
ncbi:MAG TPA: hypothetical protein PLJ21_11295, partial [Pseudobdellovibrionaceae bacterium]|nr:hypothetical protein [Pseudobdellovibrionaceae bacterium]